MKQIEIPPETIEPQVVLRNLGYGNSSPSAEVSDLINCSLQKVRGIHGIKGAYVVQPITGRSDRGLETGFGWIDSPCFAAISKDASELVFGLVTAGQAVDEKVNQSANMIEACIWDALGTVISEQAVERLLAVITSETGG